MIFDSDTALQSEVPILERVGLLLRLGMSSTSLVYRIQQVTSNTSKETSSTAICFAMLDDALKIQHWHKLLSAAVLCFEFSSLQQQNCKTILPSTLLTV